MSLTWLGSCGLGLFSPRGCTAAKVNVKGKTQQYRSAESKTFSKCVQHCPLVAKLGNSISIRYMQKIWHMTSLKSQKEQHHVLLKTAELFATSSRQNKLHSFNYNCLHLFSLWDSIRHTLFNYNSWYFALTYLCIHFFCRPEMFIIWLNIAIEQWIYP